MNDLAKYQNEKMFFAQILVETSNPNQQSFVKPLIRFFFIKPRNYSFKIVEVWMSHGPVITKSIQMKPDQQEKDASIFSVKMATNVNSNELIKFSIKIISTVENNCFVDSTWITDLCSEKQFADVDVLVGPNKVQAHRVVLSARSPVLKILLSKVSTTGKYTLTIGADEVDFFVVLHFLKYLYTGTLSISANNKQLLALAEMYQVETLKEICQLAVCVSDAEGITTSFLAII